MTGLKKLLMWKAASGGGTAPQTETLSGSLVTFETTKARPLTQCRVDFLPKQSGSGDPSPENVRPISGWDGCTVYRTGVNVFDGELEQGKLDNSGQKAESTANIRSKNYISVVSGKAYRVVYTVTSVGTANMKLYRYNKNKEFLDSSWVSGNSTIITPSNDVRYYRFYMDTAYSSSLYRDIAINRSDTATSYEPYTGTSYPVTWQSAGTVYGGYVDLVMGVLVAEYVGYTLDGTEYWSNSQSGNLYRGVLVPSSSGLEVGKGNGTIYASYAKSSSSSSAWNIFIGSTGNILLYLPTEIDNANALKQYIAEHPLQVAYQLATPITYTLTQQQITTLIGTNNIWSDAGDVTVTYTK